VRSHEDFLTGCHGRLDAALGVEPAADCLPARADGRSRDRLAERQLARGCQAELEIEQSLVGVADVLRSDEVPDRGLLDAAPIDRDTQTANRTKSKAAPKGKTTQPAAVAPAAQKAERQRRVPPVIDRDPKPSKSTNSPAVMTTAKPSPPPAVSSPVEVTKPVPRAEPPPVAMPLDAHSIDRDVKPVNVTQPAPPPTTPGEGSSPHGGAKPDITPVSTPAAPAINPALKTKLRKQLTKTQDRRRAVVYVVGQPEEWRTNSAAAQATLMAVTKDDGPIDEKDAAMFQRAFRLLSAPVTWSAAALTLLLALAQKKVPLTEVEIARLEYRSQLASRLAQPRVYRPREEREQLAAEAEGIRLRLCFDHEEVGGPRLRLRGDDSQGGAGIRSPIPRHTARPSLSPATRLAFNRDEKVRETNRSHTAPVWRRRWEHHLGDEG